MVNENSGAEISGPGVAEASRRVRSYSWKTAIGLQQVDGLVPSEYLIETANANISGDITLSEANRRISEYYEQKPASNDEEKRSEEADKVSTQIAQILLDESFMPQKSEISQECLIDIHRRLFAGVFDHAGKIRDRNLSKREWVLNDESVVYDDFRMISQSLEYDFSKEKAFDYSELNEREKITHIAKFVADLWQIHAFSEGNTRTIAVFTIKYLWFFGYTTANDTFEKHSWYFRNALVRANYSNRKEGITADSSFLIKFFENLLFSAAHELRNRDLHV